jgi:hypothetical protein
MASNAASSVQFRVNGTETARDGHAKLNARGAPTLALGGWTLESYLTHIVLTTNHRTPDDESFCDRGLEWRFACNYSVSTRTSPNFRKS